MPPARLASPLLPRALAKGIAPAYYLHGEAALLKDEALALLLERLLEAYRHNLLPQTTPPPPQRY